MPMIKWNSFPILALLAQIFLVPAAQGQQVFSIPAGTGTLTYTVTIFSATCIENVRNQEATYSISDYTKFSFTNAGVTTTFSGGTSSVSGSPGRVPGDVSCPANGGSSVVFLLPNEGIVFRPQGLTGGSVTINLAGFVYPKYKIESIIYAAPGNKSSNGYTNSTTNGATTTIGQNFTSSETTSFSSGLGFSIFGVMIGTTEGFSFGSSSTNGNSAAFTETFTSAMGVSNSSGSTSNVMSHQQDLFVLWLNPAVTLIQDGTNLVAYGVGPQTQNNQPGGPAEAMDFVEITAESMMPNASGATTVPVAILQPQGANGNLPGLANICANLISGYPASCTLANQCGCVPSDFAPILSQDPLLNFTSTESPLNANTSGSASCTNPSASASCRYVPVMISKGSSVQVTETLQGPTCTGCNFSGNSFTQTDATSTTETLNESSSYTTGSSIAVSLPPSFTLTNSNQFTWTSLESTGKTNGVTNSAAVTLSSNTVGCSEPILIFEDSVYHTFVFQQPAANNSCP